MKLRERSIYFIMGSQNTKEGAAQILKKAIAAGIDWFQYREKGTGSLEAKEKLDLGKSLRELCLKHSVTFIVNDDLELALELNADGIHIGQDDMAIKEVKRIVKDRMIVGLSTSTLEEAINAEKSGADYIGVGPIYSTTTKEDAKQSIGLTRLRTIKEHVRIPIVAIGGISEDNAAQVFNAGATSIATISAITQSKDISYTVKKMKGLEDYKS